VPARFTALQAPFVTKNRANFTFGNAIIRNGIWLIALHLLTFGAQIDAQHRQPVGDFWGYGDPESHPNQAMSNYLQSRTVFGRRRACAWRDTCVVQIRTQKAPLSMGLLECL